MFPSTLQNHSGNFYLEYIFLAESIFAHAFRSFGTHMVPHGCCFPSRMGTTSSAAGLQTDESVHPQSPGDARGTLSA